MTKNNALPPASQPWVRELERRIKDLENKSYRTDSKINVMSNRVMAPKMDLDALNVTEIRVGGEEPQVFEHEVQNYSISGNTITASTPPVPAQRGFIMEWEVDVTASVDYIQASSSLDPEMYEDPEEPTGVLAGEKATYFADESFMTGEGDSEDEMFNPVPPIVSFTLHNPAKTAFTFTVHAMRMRFIIPGEGGLRITQDGEIYFEDGAGHDRIIQEISEEQARAIVETADNLAEAKQDLEDARTEAEQNFEELDDKLGEAFPDNIFNVDLAIQQAKDLAEQQFNDSITGTLVEYARNSNETNPPVTGWSTTPPTRTPGTFIWMRTTVSYGSGDSSTTDPVLLTGNAGAQGPQGPKGDKGEKGDKGDTGTDGLPGATGVGISSTEVSYVRSTNGGVAPDHSAGWQAQPPSPIKGQYLWTRTKWTYTDGSSEYGYSSAYWATDGADGTDGVAGKDGTTLTGTVNEYAQSTSGTVPPSSGWASQPPTPVAGRFMWTRSTWSYSDGTTEEGYTVGKIGDTGAKGDKGDQGVQGPKGADGTQYYTWLKYAPNGNPTSAQMTDVPNSNSTHMGLALNQTSPTEGTNPSAYTWSLIKGTDGVQGPKGADGSSLYTWVKYAPNGNPSNAQITDLPQSNSTHIGLAYNKTTATESTSASAYTWTLIQGPKGDEGPEGDKGDTGVSVESITPHFRRLADSVAKPAKPSGMTPSGWASVEPDYVRDTTMWRSDRIVFSNGQITWTDVSKSSSYEAAKAAEAAALAYADQKKQEAIDAGAHDLANLQIGGRNLILDSGRFIENQRYDVAYYDLATPTVPGQEYTYQIKGTLPEEKTRFLFYGPAGSPFGAFGPNEVYDEETGIYWQTFTANQEVDSVRVYSYPSVSGATTTIEWVKLERGSKATDWSPAPEDVDAGIADAQAKAEGAKQEAIDEARADRLSNYGYPYSETITVYGDHDKAYPVVIYGGDQNVQREIMVKRAYNEPAPGEWNPSQPTHRGSLSVTISTNFGGWGGAQYSWFISDLAQLYNDTFASAQTVVTYMGFAIMLRGGGPGGAVYHLYSDQPLSGVHSTTGEAYPAIYYESDTVSTSAGAYTWTLPDPVTFPLSEGRKELIRSKIYKELAQEADGKATAAIADASAAMTMASGKNAVSYTTFGNSTTPPGTAPTTAMGSGRRVYDMHRNRLTNGTIIGEWIWTGSSWTRLELSDAMLSSLDVGKLTSGTANIETGVINKLWGQLGVFDKLDVRTDAYVSGINLKDGAVTARTLNVVPDSGTGGMELLPPGLRIIPDGEKGGTAVSLRTDEENWLSFAQEGESTFSVNPEGDLVAESVEARQSLVYRNRELADLLKADHLPLGIIQRFTSTNQRGYYYKETGIGYFSFLATPGRMYRVSVNARLRISGSGTAAYIRAKVRHTGSIGSGWPSAPSVSDTEVGFALVPINALTAYRSVSAEFYWTYPNPDLGAEKPTRILFTIDAQSSGAGVQMGSGAEFVIEDVGLIPEGDFSWHMGGSDGGIPPGSESTPPAPPPAKRNRTTSWTATSHRTYSYTSISHVRAGQSLVQGAISGTRSRGHWIFNDSNIRSTLSGADLESGTLTIRNQHSYAASGMTAVLRYHNYSSAPSTFGTSTAWTTVHVSRGGSATVPLTTTILNGLKAGTIRGFSLDAGSSTATSHYGYFSPSATVTINYRK